MRLVAYVGHHDDAYAWAERRRIEAHPRTGAIQVVEIRSRVETVAAPPPVARVDAAPALFARLDNDALLSIGVSTDWLADIRAATEDGFFALVAHLPAEASEALLEYAATGRLPAPAPRAADPFAHPDAQRRLRIIGDHAELEQALAYPWEKGSVFLHPSQRALVERSYSGPTRVAGSAGAGKTIVAIHRAARLAREHPDAKLLPTNFFGPLAAASRRRSSACSSEPHTSSRAVVVMACDEGVLPFDERIADAADEMELNDIYETERPLLYVACTRAREHLLLTGLAPGSEYLRDFAAV